MGFWIHLRLYRIGRRTTPLPTRAVITMQPEITGTLSPASGTTSGYLDYYTTAGLSVQLLPLDMNLGETNWGFYRTLPSCWGGGRVFEEKTGNLFDEMFC